MDIFTQSSNCNDADAFLTAASPRWGRDPVTFSLFPLRHLPNAFFDKSQGQLRGLSLQQGLSDSGFPGLGLAAPTSMGRTPALYRPVSALQITGGQLVADEFFKKALPANPIFTCNAGRRMAWGLK